MDSKIDTAMVLAAGLGTRMRPASQEKPKPLVALAGKPLIDHVLDRLAAAGIARAIVNVHHKADQIEAHLAGRQTPRVIIANEREKLLDTGGGIKKALGLLGDDGFIAHNSDSVWLERSVANSGGSNLARLIAAWNAEQMDCLLMLALGSAAVGYDGRGDFALESDGRIRRRRENDVVPFVYTGVQILHPRAFAATPDGPFSCNLVWNHAMLTGRAYGLRMDGLWMHVGAPDALAEAERVMATGRIGHE